MSIPFSIIVPAAGKGLRMGEVIPKQYLKLAGVPILERTLSRLLALQPAQLCLVVSDDDERWQILPSAENCLIASGGESRAESVLSGLHKLDLSGDPMVLVHDAVRPLFLRADVERLILEVGSSEAGGLLATPVVDTLKQANEAQQSMATPDRNQLWQAQTPQMFRADLLTEAMTHALKSGLAVTDEASAMEARGYCPRLIAASRHNIKITSPEDLAYAEFLLARQTCE